MRINLLFIAMISVCGLGCQPGSGVYTDPLRCSISGEVLLDGQPLSDAVIAFVSVDAKDSPTASGTVKDGAFSLTESTGPFPGKNRVMILPIEVDEATALERSQAANGKPVSLDKVPVPGIYGQGSKLFYDVSLNGKNSFKLEITSKGDAGKVTIVE